MSWLDQVADQVEDLRRAGQLQEDGRSAEALRILDGVLRTTTDPPPGPTPWCSASAR